MKKVIWVINMTSGKPDSGWGERHFYFSKYWVQEGYDVKIISGSYNHLFKQQPIIDNNKRFTLEKIEENITFCWVKIPKYDGGSIYKLWSMIIFALKVLSLPIKKLGRPSFIIVSSMPIYPIISGWFLKKRWKAKKLIFEIRDLWPLTPMYLKGYSKHHPMVMMMSWIEAFGYKKADHIVSLLPNSYHYINSISKDEAKFNWIPNGIDARLLEKEKLPQEVLDLIPKDKFIIGYAGTMGMANALEFLVEASILMQEDKSVHFLLVGDGYLKSIFQEQCKNQENISFIPKIKKNQVQHMLSHFDLCFIGRNDTPLFDHGVSSNKLFDYMLSKKPIISSSNKIKDAVELSGCGFVVKPESPEEIVKGIQKVKALSKEERLELGMKGYHHVSKNHNFKFLADKYLRLLK